MSPRSNVKQKVVVEKCDECAGCGIVCAECQTPRSQCMARDDSELEDHWLEICAKCKGKGILETTEWSGE